MKLSDLVTSILVGSSLLLGGADSLSAQPSSKPKLPYYDWGACPFECCTFRRWRTTSPVELRSKPSSEAPVTLKITKNVRVRGLTGVTITSRYGVTKILAPLNVGYTPAGKEAELSLKAGDLLYTLHYLGEGYDLFWYRGKVYSDQISTPGDSWEIVSQPKYVWWVKVRTKTGRVGWTDQSDRFSNQDACA